MRRLYGSVKTLEGFRGLYAIDGYHHIEQRQKYPALLFTAGANDPRVPPWQPGKMVAALRARPKSVQSLTLFRVDFDDGHGFGSTKTQVAERRADMFAFVAHVTGSDTEFARRLQAKTEK